MEGVKQFYDPAEGGFVSDRHEAIPAIWHRVRRQAVVGNAVNDFSSLRIFTSAGMTFDGVKHAFDQILNKEHFQFDGGIIDRDGQIICNIIAEGPDSAVIIGPYPFA